MKKKLNFFVFVMAATVIVTLTINIKVNGYYDYVNEYYTTDFGNYDSYTESDYGHNGEYTIYDYDDEDNILFGMNADYSSFLSYEERREKAINVYDDDPIVQYVPKSLFMNRGEYLHIGKEYGFYVNSHEITKNAIGGSIPDVNEVDVLIFDIVIQYFNECFSIEVIPLYTYTYFYFSSYMAGAIPGGWSLGVFLDEEIGYSYYCVNMQSEKAFSEGLIAPYPYCELNPNTSTSTFPCSREVAQQNMDKYGIKNVSTIVTAENINLLNPGDDGYIEEEDKGFSFYKSNLIYFKYKEMEYPGTVGDYIIADAIDVTKSNITDVILSEIPLASEILSLYRYYQGIEEHKEKIEEYFNLRYKPVTNANYYIQYYDEPNKVTDANDSNGLIKTMFYCFNTVDYENENYILLLPKKGDIIYKQEYSNYSNLVKAMYTGYFSEVDNNEIKQNTKINYDIYMQIVEYNSASESYDYTFSGEQQYSYSITGRFKELILDNLENDTFSEGYFLEGYSDLIKFTPEESGIYYFNVNELNMKLDGINYTGEVYISLEAGKEYTIEISGEDKSGAYSFIVYKQNEFDLLIDPYSENAGTEVTLNNGELNDNIMHVGFTRNLFLGANAPIDLYSSRLDYTWSSSNNSIATVSQYGTVFAKQPGEVVIKACISNRYVSEITIYIYENDITSETYLLEVSLDISEDPNVPNGTILNYVPTETEISLGCNFGSGGFDIKLGYTRCIFITNGPSTYRQDYTFVADSSFVIISQYGTISINPNIGDLVYACNITCTYKYDSAYQCVFTIYIHQQEI